MRPIMHKQFPLSETRAMTLNNKKQTSSNNKLAGQILPCAAATSKVTN